MKKVFVSYNRQDSVPVMAICKKLKEKGVNIWVDQVDIDPGKLWDNEIEQALIGSETLIIFLSPSTATSRNVMDEVSFAIEEGKTILPVMIEKCTIPFRLRRFQYVDLSNTSSIDEILTALGINIIRNESHSRFSENIEVNNGKTVKLKGIGRAVGTCGELMQGFLENNLGFHITCPITKTSTVRVSLTESSEFIFNGFEKDSQKMLLACKNTLAHFTNKKYIVDFEFWTDLEIGKGMGSSTADILAMARAVVCALDEKVSPEYLAKLATEIESSDGTMYDGINIVNHKTGELLQKLNWWPEFTIVICIPRNIVNTESANFVGKEKLTKEFNELLDNINAAVRNKDEKLFAQTCHQSAILNQNYLPNPLFTKLSKEYEKLGALGMCIGHTGTVVGLLFGGNKKNDLASEALFELEMLLPPSVKCEVTRIHSNMLECEKEYAK